MSSTRSTARGNVLVRRFSTNRPRTYVGEEDDIETTYSGEGAFSIPDSDEASVTNGDPSNMNARLWDIDESQQRIRGYDEFANRLLLPDETTLMIKKFEKAEDIAFGRTYQLGKAIKAVPEDTFEPHVGIVLLPGADLPEVNRLEQAGMVSAVPDQKDAQWRVSTAGEMLSQIIVTSDLKTVTKDVTAHVARNALARESRYSDRNFRSYSQDAVTIQSENVEIVHEFRMARQQPLDLSATLVEVNVSSLWTLMTDYNAIILKTGPQMTVQQTKMVLDRMIEAARRFCVRSPILFRMSTRKKIIDSNYTRYGVDSESFFRTFMTSKGIQEIIMRSASYYAALDPSAPGMDKDTQAIIRPKYLQMLVLLLSLLNEEDLSNTAEFLRRTYDIVPTRRDMELLFLKVMPLTSINSKVFLQGLVPAVYGWTVPDLDTYKEAGVWKNFIMHLARSGYLLPGTVEQLGHPQQSWVSSWPEEGIHSSSVFSRLQYHGEISHTFNEIPTARFAFDTELRELAVIMTNDETYNIFTKDYEQISTLTKGSYVATRSSDGAIQDMEILEDVLNGHINEAILVMNEAINRFNTQIAPSRRSGRKLEIWRRRPGDPMVFRDERPAARLTRNQAILNGSTLAIAYKLGGRNVPKVEALRYMTEQHNRVKTLFNYICESAGQRNLMYYERNIQKINQLLQSDRSVREIERQRPAISDAVIAQTLSVDDLAVAALKIWHEYRVSVDESSGRELLHIEAEQDFVVSVVWRKPGQQAEVKLANTPTTFMVSPLRPVLEMEQNDEICERDLVVLIGKYLVVAGPGITPQGQLDYHSPCVMTNWLEITDSFTENVVSRRGRNFQTKKKLPSIRFL